MKITEFIKNNILVLDGGMGTLLQQRGLRPGELPETWNITHPETICDIHHEYFNSGSNVVNTNTFGANILKFSPEELEATVRSAIKLARRAADESTGTQEKFVALDIGPTGKMLKPYGDLDFEDAVAVFAETVKLGEKCGADLIMIETMNSSYETKAALLAAKENSSLPVFVSNAYSADGKLMTGASPAAMVAMLEGMGADAVGVNCSFGPKALGTTVEEYLRYSSVPVLLKPNAGLPKSVDGKTVFDVPADEFAAEAAALVRKGVRIVGGCCGTTPEYIQKTVEAIKDLSPMPIEKKNFTCISSYTHAVIFDKEPILIGERINPTGKKQFKEALRTHDIGYILKEGIAQQERGAQVLDVNVGLPDIDEREMLTEAVTELQAVIDLPLQIDTSDSAAMEAALRRYDGKAMINSVNGKAESMAAVFPIAKKYGGLIVALTLDEGGIPGTAEERVAIAKRILAEAEKYGIDRKDIIFDPLAMTVSADKNAAAQTLRAVGMLNSLGCKTSLGVSNVSFGLPERDIITSEFFTLALGRGLSAAIMNPYSDAMMKSYFAYRALMGLDDNCADYIEFAQALPAQTTVATVAPEKAKEEYSSELQKSIIKGLKERAAALTEALIADEAPLEIVKNEIIPALDAVGLGFEKKTVYLPQLLMSAEAAKCAFEVIKAHTPSGTATGKPPFVLATVRGDIHDIGKNIVKLILENYGYPVIDLGRDVPPERVVEEVVRTHAPLVGLSALMTTTVPAMEETIKALRASAPWAKIVVGGAVLNRDYAEQIGADRYAEDAMETVRYAETIINDR
ncbi:MAG: homocysteine S-methyltransferase family protein [Eubacteriales bacterium]